ncbi:MAG: hypothetical protein N2A99_03135 [Carnobacterium alterfunditum]
MKIVREEILLNTFNTEETEDLITSIKEEIAKAILDLKWPETADGFYFHPDSKIHSKDGKKVGGNGVTTIKDPFIKDLKANGWTTEFPSNPSEEFISKISIVRGFGKSNTRIYGKVLTINREKFKIKYTDKNGESTQRDIAPDLEMPLNLSDEEMVGRYVSMEVYTPGALDLCKQNDSETFIIEWETGNVSSSHRALNKMALLLLNGNITAGFLIVPTRKMYPYLTDRIGNYEELAPYFKLWRNVNIKRGYLEIIAIEHDGLDKLAPFFPKGKDGNAIKN